MRSCPPLEQLQCLLAAQLSDADLTALAQHIEDCSSCRKALDRLSAAADSQQWRQLHEAERSSDREPRADFLRRLESFYNLGSRIIKFHMAPQTMASRNWRLDSPQMRRSATPDNTLPYRAPNPPELKKIPSNKNGFTVTV